LIDDCFVCIVSYMLIVISTYYLLFVDKCFSYDWLFVASHLFPSDCDTILHIWGCCITLL